MSVDTEIHERTTRLSTAELVRQLTSHLGPTLVAHLANVRDSKLPYKWAKAGGPEPRPESLKKLLAAHRAWTMISGADSDSVARAWFIGANPRLSEISPAEALHDGREQDVLAAAQAFVRGTDD